MDASYTDSLKTAKMELFTSKFQYTLTLILVAISLLLSGLLLYRVILHPLAKVPGPLLARMTGLWRTYHYLRGNWHYDVLELHEKYGRVVRIAPDEVSVVDAAATKQLFGHGQGANKTTWYKSFIFGGQPPTMFAVLDKTEHGAMRRRVSAAYTMSSIIRYEKYIQKCIDICFTRFQEYAKRSDTLDMSEWTSALAFDMVGELGCGSELGHLRTGSDLGDVRKAISDIIWYAANLGHIPTQTMIISHPLVSYLSSLLGFNPPFNEFLKWCREKIQARKAGKDSAERFDMLTHFMEMKPLDGSNNVDEEEILREMVTLFGAGADTTSVGMRSCLYFISSHPDVYRRLQKEIDEFYTTNQLQEPITYAQTQRIPYLKATVAEALRLLPSIPFQLLRCSPGMTISGHYIPENYVVGVSPMAANRDRAIYGEDALKFQPERWLTSPETFASLENHNMTFGGNGPRTCIGKNIALVEIQKFIAQLFRHFDVEIANKKEPWRLSSFWVASPTKLLMKITSRSVH